MNMNIADDGGGIPFIIDNDLSKLRLIVDLDDDFSSGAISISPSEIDVTNNTVKFTYSTPSSTNFFSLGSIDLNNAPLPVELVDFYAVDKDNFIAVIPIRIQNTLYNFCYIGLYE